MKDPLPAADANHVPMLRAHELCKSFGGLMAVNRVSFDLDSREIKGLVGPNGAGKTTVFNLISGYYRADSGQVLLEGRAIGNREPHQVASLGIARTFQSLQSFSNMTALENIMVGRHLHSKTGLIAAALRSPSVRHEDDRIRADALGYLERMELDHRANEFAANLSFGEQRRLEICRALASEPRVLMLDEPCAGLSQDERQHLANLIRDIRMDGVTVLLVEHDVDLVMELVDNVLVLDYGQVIAQGPPSHVQSDPRVIEAYLGTGWDAPFDNPAPVSPQRRGNDPC